MGGTPQPVGPAGPSGRGSFAGHVLALLTPWQERVSLMSSWVREGLARGERVACVHHDGEGGDAGASLLDAVAPRVDGWPAARLRGQVMVVSVRQALSAEGAFDPDSLRTRAHNAIDRALAVGYHGMRVVTIGAPFLEAVPDDGAWLALERDFERMCRELPLSVLCQYHDGAGGLVRRAAAGLHRRIVESLIEITVEGAVVRVRGEVDISNYALLESAVGSACGNAETHVDLDLTELQFMDASGLRALTSGTADFRHRSGRVILRNPGPAVARVLRLLRVDVLPGVELRQAGSA